MIHRRQLIQLAAAGLVPARRKNIATIITEYRWNSHADLIVGRLLAGYEYNGRRREPAVQVASMYADQEPADDMSRQMARRYGFRIAPTVHDALTADTEGVVLVGEHGWYPYNEKGQHVYPRYELFREIIDVFRERRHVVPVFCDKHLSVEWEKAKWMYDQSRELKFPLLAGSSLPLAWRRPPLELELETPLDRAVVAFYGDKEAYGFHALEALQCMVERRRGGETGVASVHCLEGADVWNWTDANPRSAALLDGALARVETRHAGSVRDNARRPILFLLRYRDGLQAAVYILRGHIDQAAFAASIVGRSEPVSTEMWLQPGRPFGHFSALVYRIERLIETGRPDFPVERTLLTTGVLAALMDSTYRGSRLIETPHLGVSYRAPRESLFTRGAVPSPE
jgi:hypothetical protein